MSWLNDALDTVANAADSWANEIAAKEQIDVQQEALISGITSESAYTRLGCDTPPRYNFTGLEVL